MEDEVDPVSLFLSLEQWQDPDEFSLLQDFPPSQPPPETFMVGFIIANIVGIQYYSGTISGREMVGLVREPLNTYDPNAIKQVVSVLDLIEEVAGSLVSFSVLLLWLISICRRIWSIWTARQPAVVGNGHKNKVPLAILAMARTISH
ncbi:hypothetical protein SO802_015763 [Lithocarpus litseifolius]|uniref:HIRAN domain-containing protein n=1 Tax=Lithocarpus litseifolius TaxID=425828 RepID=A0AAW2CWW9_9ROSI